MHENVLLALAGIVALGVGAQWIAWRFNLPAILLLLVAGFVAGPVTGTIDPGDLLGDLFIPVVSASVAIILFEGGLSLSLRELKATGSVLWRLVSVGALATWAIGALSARYLAGVSWEISLLIGAILTVTGPTVIGPLLRQVRPTGRVGTVLRWEGILIDPIGAVLAVLVFEAIQLERRSDAVSAVVEGVLRTAGVGIGVGVFAAALLVLFIKRYLIPDFLHNAVSLAVVMASFTIASELVPEGGLVAVTVMGIVLANQRIAPVRHIIEFKETLRVLLISGLFIILAADLDLASLRLVGWHAAPFLAAVLAARFVSVWLSTIGSKLERRERLFLATVAPRGIVAAAVTSVFALQLSPVVYPDSKRLVPLVFVVIVGTIVIYGIAAPRIARALDLSDRDPQGALLVGANPLARAIAAALVEENLRVELIDTDWGNVSAAKMHGLNAHYQSILSEDIYQLDLGGVGRLIALTSNDELNSLAVQHTMHLFGRALVYQLAPREGGSPRRVALASHQRGRTLFDKESTYAVLAERMQRGATVKKTPLSEEFTFQRFRERYGDAATPMFVITAAGKLQVFVVDGKLNPKPGDKLISLVDPGAGEESAERAAATAGT